MRRVAVSFIAIGLVAAAAAGWVVAHRDVRVAAPVVPAPKPVPPALDGIFDNHSVFGPVPAPIPQDHPPSKPVLAIDQVREAIATSYYRHVSPELLVRPSIPEILGGLEDPFTEYLTPDELAALEAELAPNFFGVGLTVSPAEHGLLVTSSLNGPAREAGIRPGDVIVRIDGKRAVKLGFSQATALIPGESGTVVRLTIRRPGERKPIHFEVVRGEVRVQAVKSRMLDPEGAKIGFIRLANFSQGAAQSVYAATKRLTEAGASSLVLDLRGNPGGLLSEAISITSLYLESGIICSTESVNQASRVFRVTGAPLETELPLVLLVDGGTASAAEIVAGALHDNERGPIVGTRTYGKATVQSLLTLSDGAALRLTTAGYLTPSGTSIAGTGLKPTIRVADDPATKPDEALEAVRELLAAPDEAEEEDVGTEAEAEAEAEAELEVDAEAAASDG